MNNRFVYSGIIVKHNISFIPFYKVFDDNLLKLVGCKVQLPYYVLSSRNGVNMMRNRTNPWVSMTLNHNLLK